MSRSFRNFRKFYCSKITTYTVYDTCNKRCEEPSIEPRLGS